MLANVNGQEGDPSIGPARVELSVCTDPSRPQDSAQAQQFIGLAVALLMITHLGIQKVS